MKKWIIVTGVCVFALSGCKELLSDLESRHNSHEEHSDSASTPTLRAGARHELYGRIARIDAVPGTVEVTYSDPLRQSRLIEVGLKDAKLKTKPDDRAVSLETFLSEAQEGDYFEARGERDSTGMLRASEAELHLQTPPNPRNGLFNESIGHRDEDDDDRHDDDHGRHGDD